MKKVLVITYYWPPSGGSGVQRWMYFCKYLSDFGYTPIVLTVSEKSAAYKNIDNHFIEKVKDIETYKTKTFEPLKLYSWLTTGNTKKGIPHGNVHTKKGFFQKAMAFIRGNFFVPDARIGWKSYALKQARKIIQSQQIHCIITTGPPHSAHLIGLQLQKETHIKWIADLRDPWSDIYYNKDFMRLDSVQKKDTFLEKNVLEKADGILTVGFKLKELLQKKAPGFEKKFHHIYNGYDAFLMDAIETHLHSHFEVTFIGLLTKKQPYVAILKTIQLFLEAHKNTSIKVCFAGNIDAEILEAFQKEIPQYLDVKGYVSHKKSLELMKQSQLLVNCLPEMADSQILISGKQMEYIATGNPILCFGNTEGECAILMEDIENAKIVEKHQIKEAAEFLSHVYQKWQAKEPFLNAANHQSIQNKSRYETTRELAAYLDGLISE